MDHARGGHAARAREALRGADALVHAQPHDPAIGSGPGAEQELLVGHPDPPPGYFPHRGKGIAHYHLGQYDEALKICELVFGRKSLVEGVVSGPVIWAEVDPLFVAFPLAIVTTIVVSMVTKKFSRVHVSNCFAGFDSAPAGN